MLKVSNVGKRFEERSLFTGVSFVLGPEDRFGLVGPNAVGKSTLLRILAGLEQPDEGSVHGDGGTRVGYLPQEPLDVDMSLAAHLEAAHADLYRVRREMVELETEMARHEPTPDVLDAYGRLQHLFDALDGWNYEARVENVRRHLGIDHISAETRLGNLSGGQQARVMLASVLLSEPTELLLDEPTNHLDLDGLSWLERFLASFRGGVIVVSHDRRFLDNTVHRIVELDGVRPEADFFEGGYNDYREEKQRRFVRWQADFEAQEEYRRRLEADIERTRRQALSVELSTRNDRARRYAKKVARKAKARERRLTRQTEAADWVPPPRQPDRIALTTSAVSAAGRALLRLSDVVVKLDNRTVLRDVDLTLRGRERLAVIGRNGAGKTTLLRVMSGELPPSSGGVEAASTIAVLPQDHSRLPLGQTVLRYFRGTVVSHEDEARTFLARFLFPATMLGRSLGRLSPGERSRLLIAVMVASRAQLLLLDEPTNHLDFASLDVVEEALSAFEGTVVVVSHDRAFVENIGCDRLVEVHEQTIVERPLAFMTGDGATTQDGTPGAELGHDAP